MMNNNNFQEHISIPVASNIEDLIRQLMTENTQLLADKADLNKAVEESRIIIDQLTNYEAFLREAVQQLRDEIEFLKN